MRRASRPSVLLLVVLAGLLGAPAMASASDVGLRALVVEETAAEKRSDAAAERIPEPKKGSNRSLATYLDRYARHFASVERTVDGFRRRYAAEAPETPAVLAAREQVLLGLRDISNGAHGFAVAARRAAARYRKVRTDAGADSVARRFDRDLKTPTKTLKRGNQRDAKGRKAILENSPVPATPAG
ncbi:hypothetical protein [Patulibacter minatonensis]|uniref:hypothetical protein n=1 Tax=Patulibacter minatonensis TaxID=298163 RepID=UPI00047B46A5|nr:hypothetical protein [Patulibacter minatonensis]